MDLGEEGFFTGMMETHRLKAIKPFIYIVWCGLALVLVFAQYSHGKISTEIEEERMTMGVTERFLTDCLRHETKEIQDNQFVSPITRCLVYLYTFIHHEKTELSESPKNNMISRIEDREIALLQSMITSLKNSDLNALDRQGRLLQSIEEGEVDFLQKKRANWGWKRLIVSISMAALVLLHFSWILSRFLTGGVYSNSLSIAGIYFGKSYVAKQYVVKRKPPDSFEIEVIRETLKTLPRIRRILDIPCGAGRFIPVFYDFGLDYYGADYSEPMVALAKTVKPLSDSSRIRRCDILDLPYPDKFFDCVFVIRLFHHVPDRDERVQIFRQLNRVTRYGVVFSFFDSRSLSHLFYAAKHMFLLKPLWRHALSANQLNRELKEAGLKVKQTFYRSRWIKRRAFMLAVSDTSPSLGDCKI